MEAVEVGQEEREHYEQVGQERLAAGVLGDAFEEFDDAGFAGGGAGWRGVQADVGLVQLGALEEVFEVVGV